ncbi:hypothetical protein CC1G_05532 [Coprinopsis cinerea okayama7|uniref:Uncharacterized protein n=1 Tax=Coprinopsis cinerea (strain Okayama-7 / 130 / ATCC MYA-4618 / FGSC 9003) TaxID=240176 RepID=A8P5M6_COPC7|nr:hypothetical protein CC1G_05532 [Coprinopsis cinerea okayama7\|eukprot:XP_001838979.2 hypothetical protein CC1G_05532 [Coprinopsis cinerea okayama7\
MQTITAGDAESLDGIKPKLKPTELATLPHEWRPSPHNRDRKMKLFNKDDVRRLIRERCKAWNVDVPSPSVGGPFSERFNDKGVIEKHEYIPPPNASPDDPNPSEINWIGQHLPAPALMNEKEACFMYLLEPRDLDPLRGSSTSSWFDQKSVAIRAATVHGGVRNHNQLIINKRLEDIENGEATQEMPAGLKKFLKYLNDPGPYGEYDSANDPVKSVEQKNKEIWQYLPVYEDGTFENGQNFRWRMHGFKRLSSSDLMLSPVS